MNLELIEAMAQLGVAGVMGALWVWERAMSRQRERQLTAAHQRLMRQREQLDVLVRMVHRNTAAIERFEQTQSQLRGLLEKFVENEPRRAA